MQMRIERRENTHHLGNVAGTVPHAISVRASPWKRKCKIL